MDTIITRKKRSKWLQSNFAGEIDKPYSFSDSTIKSAIPTSRKDYSFVVAWQLDEDKEEVE